MDLMNRCQIITPTETHWIHAGELLNVMRRRQHYEVNKLRELASDVLIALTARSIGATVIPATKLTFKPSAAISLLISSAGNNLFLTRRF